MKQANVKMLFSALAFLVFLFIRMSSMRFCCKQVEFHITCPIFFLNVIAKSPDLIYECTHFILIFFLFMLNVFNVNSGQECQIHVELLSMSITDFNYSQVGHTWP